MASYIPKNHKYRESLASREETLRRLIKCGVCREKPLKAAMEVRNGRIRVRRAKQNLNPNRSPTERAEMQPPRQRTRQEQTASPHAAKTATCAGKAPCCLASIGPWGVIAGEP